MGLKIKRSSENLEVRVFRRPCFYLWSSTSRVWRESRVYRLNEFDFT
ncbi:hypothetical protein [Neisseria sicca]|nr:hypothetical protein [Neisseria sicca]